ncbi:MAG: shikimate 5-dehydrogenase [Bdellovibrionota bacterium]
MMLPHFDCETRLCISLAARPSSFGTRFHNFLYRELGLNFVYKACSPRELKAAVEGIRALGIRGSAVSMPFKEAVIELLDEIDPEAKAIGAVNTIVNDQGKLKGYNTDVSAVRALLRRHASLAHMKVALLGSGGMAKAVAFGLREQAVRRCTVFSRNPETGKALASAYGFGWKPRIEQPNHDVLINLTPIGMGPNPQREIPFNRAMILSSKLVIDVVGSPPETELIRLARSLGKSVIAGHEFTSLSGAEQFFLYTGVRPDPGSVGRAAEFARADSS